MHIAYIAHTRFPTEKAHGNQIAQVCQALTRIGHDVTLVTPTVWNAITEDPFRYYGMQPSFEVVKLDHFDALRSPLVPGFLGFALSMQFYGHALTRYLDAHAADLLYVRSPLLLSPLLRSGIPLVLELHTLPRRDRRRFLRQAGQCAKVVCLTSAMREELVSWGMDPQSVSVEADGVDLERFAHLPAPVVAKRHWKLPADRPVVGYVGMLAAQDRLEKGIGEFIGALALLKRKHAKVIGWIVGGPEDRRQAYQAEATAKGLTEDEVRFEGRIASKEVPSAIAGCDICVYPAPASEHPYHVRDTSPLKLFEYLAAGKQIVSADLPPIRDIVDESVVRFVHPGDDLSLADGISWVLSHQAEAREMATKGKEIVQKHAWEERMRRIVKI